MTAPASRRPLAVGLAVVAAVGVVHRAVVLLVHRDALAAHIAANAAWQTTQYLPLDMLREHLLASMVLLQQHPPIPNLLVGAVAKLPPWPAAAAWTLISLQCALSIASALVMVHVLVTLYPRRAALWIGLPLVFLLNTDLVVMEYNSLGQTIYEPLAMFGAVVTVDALLQLHVTGRLGWAALAGAAVGALALTRSTWCFFALPTLLLVAGLAPGRRSRAVLACLLPILVLQGGWMLKTWAVYRVWTPTTTSCGGLHLASGLTSAGVGQGFRERVERGPVGEFFRALRQGDTASLEARFGERDRAVERLTGLTNPWPNTNTNRVICDGMQREWVAFARDHPELIALKWWRGYRVFWQPIANYGRMFVALFETPPVTDGFDVAGIARGYLSGALPGTVYVVGGTSPYTRGPKTPQTRTPTSIYTLRWLEPAILVLNVVGIHLLLPLVALCWLARRARLAPLPMAALLCLATTYWYLAGLANLIETPENMRYRLEVEPIVWLITAIAAIELVRALRGRPTAEA